MPGTASPFLVAITGGLTLFGLFDRFSPYLELLTLVRLNYAALLTAAALMAIPLRLFRVALLAGVNITGALVFQSKIPLAFGLAFTDWHLNNYSKALLYAAFVVYVVATV